jgi:hypothetical protein
MIFFGSCGIDCYVDPEFVQVDACNTTLADVNTEPPRETHPMNRPPPVNIRQVTDRVMTSLWHDDS